MTAETPTERNQTSAPQAESETKTSTVPDPAPHTAPHTVPRTVPQTMRVAAIDRFGGPDVFRVQQVKVPDVGPNEILISVKAAGVGVWDPYEREGLEVQSYDGMPTLEGIERLNELIERDGSFYVHVAEVFSLGQAADAHRKLDEHFLGKLALEP